MKELTDGVAKAHSMISEQSWWSAEVSGDWRKGNIPPMVSKGRKGDPWSYQPVSLTLVPMEQILLETLLRPMGVM